ncbi:MAG: emp24/gp25L/p24 family protein [Candidatus Bathyarchaeota archaeon]|nr:emp24/gp25L/p24 family protein [Candidatus Bathyarchaeota archaeon]
MRAEALTTIGIVVTVLGLLFFTSILILTSTDDYDISPGGEMSLTRHREKGERIEGYFTVLGGNEEIEFYVEDPFGVIIHNAGIIKSRHDFALTTEHSGVYTLFFGNKQQSGKVVYLSSKMMIIGPDASLAITILGILFLILGSIDIYQKRQKTKARDARAFFGHRSINVSTRRNELTSLKV